MKQTIVVCGYGPGISSAVAEKFGREGHPVAIVARNVEKLSAGVQALSAAGIKAKAFPCDLGEPDAVRLLISDVRDALGPIGVLHYNAYVGGAGDLTTATIDELYSVLDVSVAGLITAVQAALPDLKASKGALLVTGGGFSFYDPKIDAMAAQWNFMGLAVGKAAQHKTVGLLRQKLAGDGVYVGEVVVLGSVKGTPFDQGNATLEGSTIAEKFWELYVKRAEASVNVG